MRALLLAAGLGTRLRPVTDTIPKCLVPIGEKSLIDYWFKLLFEGGVERILVNMHYLPDLVRDHVLVSPWRDRIDLVHEDKLLGTGGTILANRDFFDGQTFLVAHADNLTWFDLNAFNEAHSRRPGGSNTIATMMTFDTDSPQTCGIVECDSDGLVSAFHEKVPNPPGKRANGAVYIFEPSLLDVLAHLDRGMIDLSTDILPSLMGRMATFHNDCYLRDIGSVVSLAQARNEIKDIRMFSYNEGK